MNLIIKILEHFGFVGHLKFGSTVPRSPLWEKCKKDFALTHPKKCSVCGKTKVQLHHKKPFHANPELELEPTNLIWLCEGVLTNNHHLWVGHLGNFQSINDEIDHWLDKIAHRPLFNGKSWVNT